MVMMTKRIGTTWVCGDCAANDNVTWAAHNVTADYDVDTNDGVATFSRDICGTCADKAAGWRFRFAIWEGGN